MSEQQGIKELVELVQGVKVLAVMGAKVYADKKVGLDDFPILLDAVKDFGKLVDAFKGLDLVDDELKDLDADEVKRLFSELKDVFVSAKAELNKDVVA